MRSEKRQSAGTAIESQATGSLKPWREVVTPHTDVASGRYQQAEFAADLWQVHLGEGSDEYREAGRVLPPHLSHREPEAPARRRACSASSGKGGDPVVQLQTNFGGGKTHSMLALYHLFSGTRRASWPASTPCWPRPASKSLPKAKRVVLVGNKISPGNPVDEAGRHGGAHAVGRAGLAARRQEGASRASRPTTRRRRAPATCCASCSTSTGRA